jgi:cell division protein FtsN
VEVEVTPAGKVISQPGEAKEPEQAKQKEETSQKETSKEAGKEETSVPPVVASVAPSSPQNVAMVPSLPNVPRNPSDEFRFGRQSSAPGEITTPLSGMVYSVQVASSPSKRDAERLQQKYGQLGYLAYIMTADLGEKGIWYRVRVGNLQTRTEAEILKEELLEKAPRLTNKPFVIKVTGE